MSRRELAWLLLDLGIITLVTTLYVLALYWIVG